MTTYNITSEKLQELNELINTGGQIPTDVNAATGQTAALLDQNKIDAAKASNLNASKQNDRSGGAWSNVQRWHNEVKNSGGGEPPPTQSGTPLAVTPNDGVTYRFSPLVAGSNVSTKAGGDGYFSAASGSGNAWWLVWVNGAQIINGGMDRVPVKAGDIIDWGIATPAWQDICTYSIN